MCGGCVGTEYPERVRAGTGGPGTGTGFGPGPGPSLCSRPRAPPAWRADLSS